jgi:hypothetical protein
MQTLKKRNHFFESEEAEDIRQKLRHMMSSDLYNTPPSFTADDIQYPDNLMPFLDKHMNYLNAHPMLDASMYLANLRLKTRIRK